MDGMDIATLKIEIDTKDVADAGKEMKKLADAAEQVESAQKKAASSSQRLQQCLEKTGQSLSAADKAMEATATATARYFRELEDCAGKQKITFKETLDAIVNYSNAIEAALKAALDTESAEALGFAAADAGKALAAIFGNINGITDAGNKFGKVIEADARYLEILAKDVISGKASFEEFMEAAVNAEASIERLTGGVKPFIEGYEKAGQVIGGMLAEIKGLDKALGWFEQTFSELADTKKALDGIGNAFVSNSLLGVKAASIGVAAWRELNQEFLAAKKRLDDIGNAYSNAFGENAQKLLGVVNEQCQRLGMGFGETARMAQSFFELGKGTPIAAHMTDIFKSVTDAGAALELTEKQVAGALNSMGQLANSQKISISDLTEKLGKDLPGALNYAAEGMGITTAEMLNLSQQGKLLSEDVLPAIARALDEKCAEAAVEAADTMEKQTARMENAWEQFKANLAASDPAVFVVKFIAEGLEGINARVAQFNERKALEKEMLAAGIKPETRSDYDAMGMSIQVSEFSDRQIAAWKNEKELDLRGAEYTRQAIEESEKRIAQYEKEAASLKSLGKSGRINALNERKEKFEANYKAIVANAKASGASAETLKQLADNYAAAIEGWNTAYARAEKAGTSRGKSATSATQKAASAQSEYAAKIAESEAKAAKLETQLERNLGAEQALGLEKKRIEAEYQAQLEKDAKERLAMSKSVSAAELAQYEVAQKKVAEMERDLKLRDAEKNAIQRNAQLADGQLKFYKDLARLSGGYTNDLGLQKQLIAAQAKQYREVYHIAGELVDEWERLMLLQESDDPFDGATRGLLRFSAEMADTGKQWESLAYNFAKSFTDKTHDMFDEFLETGKISFDGFRALYKQLLKDLAWQALAQPIVMSIVGGWAGGAAAMGSGGGNGGYASGGQGGAGQAGGVDIGGLASSGSGLLQQYGMSQLMGGGGIMGNVTGWINSGAASAFPSIFASSASDAALNLATMAEHEMAGVAVPALPTSTFMGSLAIPALGAGLGSFASPFVNNLLGLQNNTGSQVGSLVDGGLGTVGGAMLAAAPAMAAVPGIGWIAGGIAALGSLLGGGVGSLFGGFQPEEPELYLSAGASLWKERERKREAVSPGGATAMYYDDSMYAWMSGNQGTDYWTARGVADSVNEFIGQYQDISMNIADSLGKISKTMKTDYLAALEKNGPVGSYLYLAGDQLNDGQIQSFMQGLGQGMLSAMITALGEVDLKPLTEAAGGFAAKSVDDMADAFNKLVSFANIASSIDDENLRQQFEEKAIGQIASALDNLDFGPMIESANKLADNAMDGLTDALEDAFSVYDLSANIQDDTIRQAVQKQLQDMIVEAFKNIDMSFLRVDFDQDSFEGLQQAYAAAEAWKSVTKAIDEFLEPSGEVELAMEATNDQFDEWLKNLEKLGWQEEALAEIEGKRAAYLKKYREQLEREMRQSLSLRYTALAYGDNSKEYALQSLLYQQVNEREGWEQKFGAGSQLYKAGVSLQQAEVTRLLLEQFEAMRQTLLEEKKQAEIAEIQSRMAALSEEISAKQKLISETERLADRFRRLAKSLEEYRSELWSGQDNLAGGRYNEAYSQFNSLYKRALEGDEDAYNELSGKASELLSLGRDFLPERGEYNDLFYDVDQKLKHAQLFAEKQVSEAERQLAELSRISEQLQGQYDILQKQLDAINAQAETASKIEFTLEEVEAAVKYLGEIDKENMERLSKDSVFTTLVGVNETYWPQALAAIIDLKNGIHGVYQAIVDAATGKQTASASSTATKTDTSSNSKKSASQSVANSNPLAWAVTSDEPISKLVGKYKGSGIIAKRDQCPRSQVQSRLQQLNATTVFQWEIEKFAKGGVTPANEPFWVGENGPELMMSPARYGVLSNEASMALMSGRAGDDEILAELRRGFALMALYLRQVVVKTDRTAWLNEGMRGILREWNEIGLPKEADA